MIICIKSRKFTKKKLSPSNEVTEDDINFFLEIDLDGNIIWIREEENLTDHHLSLAEVANVSQEFLEYFSTKSVDTKNES